MKKYSNLALCQRNIVKAVCSYSPGHPQSHAYVALLCVFVVNRGFVVPNTASKQGIPSINPHSNTASTGTKRNWLISYGP